MGQMGARTSHTDMQRLWVVVWVAVVGAASSVRAQSSSSTGDSFISSSSSSGDFNSSTASNFPRDSSVQLMYQWEYIVASYIIACAGSAAALQVMRQRTGLRGTRNWLLLLGGSIALGVIGVWCMHFIGMMSLMIKSADGEELRMAFEPGLTVVSLIVAVVIVGVGFALAGDPSSVRVWRTCLVGVVGGCGVAVMHYVGMISMVCRASITYDPGVVFASVLVGIVACIAAFLIFFHLQHVWHKDWRLQAVIPLIMGLAVCGMHYSGMAAASWHDSFDEPNFDGYATQEQLLATVLTLAGVTSAALLTFSLWRMRKLRQIEAAKSSCLTLAALVRDSQGRVLCTLAQTLPSVVIRATVAGEPVGLHALSADFLRMLKISFAWPSVARYQRHLNKLHSEGQIPASSVRYFDAFVAAATALAAQLNLPLEQLGFLHWAPTGNMLTLCVRNTAATRLALQQSHAGLRFAEPLQLKATLSEWQLPPTVDALEWLDEIADYQRRVLLPLCGDARDEQLEQFLREVCHELLDDKDAADEEVRLWRNQLGRFVNTKTHLATLARNGNQWCDVQLDPMVKAQIEQHLAIEAAQAGLGARPRTAAGAGAVGEGGGGGAGGGGDIAPGGPPAASGGVQSLQTAAPLYVGLLHIQVSATGLQVLLPKRGPLSMIPLVRLSHSHTVGSRELVWLQQRLFKDEVAKITSRKRAQQRHQQQQQQPQDAPQPITQFFTPSHTGAVGNKQAIPPLPGSVPTTAQSGQTSTPASDPETPLIGGARVRQPQMRSTAPSMVESNNQQQAEQGQGQQREYSRAPMSVSQRPQPLLATTDALLAFQADLLRAREELGKLVGSSADLISSQLWTDHVIVLNSETSMLVFLHCSMGRGLPTHYSPRDVQHVPLSVFDILHSAQHPSRTAHQWTRKLLAVAMKSARHKGFGQQHMMQLNGAQNHAIGGGAANGGNAVGFDDPAGLHSLLGGEKSHGTGSCVDEDSMQDESTIQPPQQRAAMRGAGGAAGRYVPSDDDVLDRDHSDREDFEVLSPQNAFSPSPKNLPIGSGGGSPYGEDQRPPSPLVSPPPVHLPTSGTVHRRTQSADVRQHSPSTVSFPSALDSQAGIVQLVQLTQLQGGTLASPSDVTSPNSGRRGAQRHSGTHSQLPPTVPQLSAQSSGGGTSQRIDGRFIYPSSNAPTSRRVAGAIVRRPSAGGSTNTGSRRSSQGQAGSSTGPGNQVLVVDRGHSGSTPPGAVAPSTHPTLTTAPSNVNIDIAVQ